MLKLTAMGARGDRRLLDVGMEDDDLMAPLGQQPATGDVPPPNRDRSLA